MQHRCSEKSRKIHGKFHVSTAGFCISENRSCLAGCKFIGDLQKSVFKILSLSNEVHFSKDTGLMNIQPMH